MNDAYNAGKAAGIRAAAEFHRSQQARWQKVIDDDPSPLSSDKWGATVANHSAYADAILALLDAPAPAGVTVQEAARLICDEVLQKQCPVAGRQRVRMINATLSVKIPSIPRAQRWAIVNAALRALSGDRT
jgi:hypothetical protein